MHKKWMPASLFVLVLLPVSAGLAGEGDPAQEEAGAPAAPHSPALPRQGGAAVATVPEPDRLASEQLALERVAERFARRIGELEELARQVTGAELAEIHRQIEDAKLQQEKEELRARLEVAGEIGDARRVLQLEQVLEAQSRPKPPPPSPPESRPAPDRAPEGGGR